MLNRLADAFASFHRHQVEYLVIGGIAAVLYGVPRATFDLGILVESSTENVRCLLDALEEAGLATTSLTSAGELVGNEITVFQDRVRIDVQTWTPGINFVEAWKNRNVMEYAGRSFYVVSREDLILSKRASGHEVDLEDVRLLELPE